MSKTVDERVVEMRFDNKHFESNVKTSMSTLDKLKQKLNFSSASKGLENLNSSVKNVNMSTLGKGVEVVHAKFSALEVMGVTALANITNSAVNAGKRIVKALTIDPIKTGFNEYELKMDSVKTIMASTGESVEKVNEYLEELNKYSDQTIYSFSDMTQNIGKFTNAGVKLEDAVMAIKGISNEAAVSGANATQAAHAMYNFAQALSSGYVKLIDWKSIENANMATVEFKQQLIDTAVELGTVTKAADGMYQTLDGNVFNATKNFNEVFQDQWMTSEVLVETLKDYADETTEIGKKAFAAAQDVTKLSQMFDILKETAQSGWAKTWEILFGDINQAKALFTPLTEFFSNLINKISDFRNNLLEGALGSPLGKLATKLGEYGKATGKAVDKTKELGDIVNRVIRGDFGNTEERWNKLTELGYNWAQVQNKVNEQLGYTKRHNEELGESQEKVNKTQGETIEQLLKKNDAELESLGFTKAEIKALRELQEEAKRTGKPIEELIDKMSQPKSGRELIIESFKNAGKGLLEVIGAIKDAWIDIFPPKSMDERVANLYNGISKVAEFTKKLIPSADTVDKLTRTFKGLFAVIDIITDITGGAFKIAIQVIGKLLGIVDLDILSLTAKIGDLLVKFRDWLDTNGLITKAADKIVAGLKAAYKFISKWIKAFFDLPVVQKFIENFKEAFTLDNIVNGVKKAYNTVKKWIGVFMELPLVQKILEKFKGAAVGAFDIGKNIVKSIKGGYFLSYMKELATKAVAALKKGFAKVGEIGKNIVQGLINGIKDGSIWQAIKDFANKIIDTVCDILGIHSPSRVFEWIGENIILGLINGIKAMVSGLFGFISDIVNIIVEKFKSIDINWDYILEVGKNAGIIAILYKLSSALATLVMPLKGVSDLMSGAGDTMSAFAKKLPTLMKAASKVLKSFSGTLRALSFNIRAKAIKDIAMSIIMLAGAIAILAFLDVDGVWEAFGLIAALTALLACMMGVMTLFGKLSTLTTTIVDKDGNKTIKETAQVAKITGAIIAIAGSLLTMSIAMKMLGDMDDDEFKQGILGMLGMLAGITLFLGAYGAFVSEAASANLDKAGKLIFKVAISIGLLTLIGKSIAKFTKEATVGDVASAILGLVGLGAFMYVFVETFGGIAENAGNHADKIGKAILKIVIAIGLLVLIVKSISKFIKETDGWNIAGSVVSLIGLGLFITELTNMTYLVNKNLDQIGNTLLKMAAAIGILAIVAKVLATMSLTDILTAGTALAALVGIVALMVSVMNLVPTLIKMKNAETEMMDIGKTLLAMSGAIAILAGLMIVLGMIDPEILSNGIGWLFLLSGFMAALTWVSKYTSPNMGSIIALGACVAVLAGVLIGLSFIDPDKLVTPIIGLVFLMGMLAILIKVTGESIVESTTTIVGIGVLGAVILALAGAVLMLKNVNPGEAITAVVGIAAMLFIFKKALDAFGTLTSTINIGSVLLMVGVMAALAGVLWLLSTVSGSVGKSVVAMAGMTVVFAMLTTVGILADKAIKSWQAITMMTLVTAAMAAIIYLLQDVPVANAVGVATGLSIMIVALSVAFKKLASCGDVTGTAMIQAGIMTLVILALGGILYLMQWLDPLSAIGSAIALSIFIVALTGALKILGSVNSEANVVKALALAGVVAILAVVVGILSVLPVEGIVGAALSLSAMIIALTVALNIMQGSVGGAAALLVVAVALTVLAVPLIMLSTLSWTELATGLVGLAVGLGLVVGAGALAQTVALGLLALGAAIVLIGGGCLLAGVGLNQFAQGITMLVNVPWGAMIVGILGISVAFLAVAASSLSLIVATPMILLLSVALAALSLSSAIAGPAMTMLASALNSLSGVSFTEISVGMLALAGGMTALGVASLTAIVAAPLLIALSAALTGFGAGCTIAAAGMLLAATALTALTSAFSSAAPSLSAAAGNMFKSITNAIKNVLKSAVSAVKNLARNIMDSGFIKGIKSRLSAAVKSVKEIPSKCIEGIKSFVNDFKNMGKNVVEGFTKGIKNSITGAVEAVKSLGSKVKNGLKNFLGIHSPSRVFAELGMYSGEGFIQGLESTSGDAVSAAKEYGSGIIDGVNEGIDLDDVDLSSITEEFGGLEDIDLSNLEGVDASGITSLDGMDFSSLSSIGDADFSSATTFMQEYNAAENKEFVISAPEDGFEAALPEHLQNIEESALSAEEKLEEVKKVVADIWAGKLGTGQERFDALAELGYIPQQIQDLVNKGAGYEIKPEDVIHIENSKWAKYIDASIEDLSPVFDTLYKKLYDATLAGEDTQAILDEYNKTLSDAGIEKTLEIVNKEAEILASVKNATKDQVLRNEWDNLDTFSYHGSGFDDVMESWTDATSDLDKAISLVKLYNEKRAWVMSMIKRGQDGIEFEDGSYISGEDAIAQGLAFSPEALTDFEKLYNHVQNISGLDWDDPKFTAQLTAAWNEQKYITAGLERAQELAEVTANKQKTTEALWKEIKKKQDEINQLKANVEWTRNNIGTIEAETEAIEKLIKPNSELNNLMEEYLSLTGVYADHSNVDNTGGLLTAYNFKDLGKNLINGLTSGIKAYENEGVDTVVKMSKHIIQKTEDTFGIHSPSKVFYNIARYIVQGFCNGLYDGESPIEVAAETGIAGAIRRITDFVNNDIEAQPTIRPVFDLTDLESGANTISNMFGDGVSVGLLGNVGSISSAMNNQNGSQNEIIQAINKVNNKLDNISKPTYNVNGVTYDDGSNVSNAVKTLIRAAKIERRV